VKLSVYNIRGQEVETLINGFKEQGEHKVSWNPGNIPTGLYIARLESGNLVQCSTMIYSK
jgi:hypothetical protein